ncbi:MAG: NFACT RNA binding domain-containing protein, partial [Eubacteriaceae bacterium]|nr:NFACT RNA binding domain-containing protein [Eubacteriaceae bacterium]
IAREICYRAGVDSELQPDDLGKKQLDYLSNAFFEIQHEIVSGPNPTLYYFNHRIQDFSTVSLHHLNDLESHPQGNVSEMLEAFYYLKDKKNRFTAKSANLKHHLSAFYKKNGKKLQNLRHDLQKSQKAEKSKRYGDLVTANIYQIKKGMKAVEVPDFNDPELKPVCIPLKVNETPAQNAQRYYKKYNKAKRAQIQLAGQIKTTEEQVYYLESLLNALEQCTELNELDEIRHEVAHSEFGKRQKMKEKEKKPLASKPLHFVSSEGFHIYVGKNNYQNDTISTKLGIDEDCWLHVKDIPGSHVLVVADGRFITEDTLLEAGSLAAWFSQAKNSQNVPVDYVEYKYVKKPKKAKPGMVIFTNQNTMYVTPKRDKVDALTQITDD